MLKYIFSNLILLFFMTITIISCHENIKNTSNDYKIEKYKISVYKNKDNGWGYNILNNNKIIIHQPTIPALEGNISFRTPKDAYLTANKMIEKLNKNIFPPSLTIEEINNIIQKN